MVVSGCQSGLLMPWTTLDMDCMICFNKYSIYRVPKLLDCQHTFCAICLKLILRKEENTWIITCPLCRKPTLVSGGLIRTLQNKEDILERLENLDSNPEVYIYTMGLDGNSWTPSSQDILNTEENSPAHTSLVVQRLVLLLLLGVILTILILPFMYSGRVKWVICLLLTLGLLMSMMLCYAHRGKQKSIDCCATPRLIFLNGMSPLNLK
uniref:Ring finger protein 186 n=1 Tax=Cyanoderma ruficeps TaxID=181631 RepID=A0A8C3XBH4_9PASS